MPLTTNASPYWDDYKEDKEFYRILFRPGHAVQARELTQLQTNLQKQIERHGKNAFAHGARVLDGQTAYNKCDYIKLSDYEKNDPNEGTLINVSGALADGAAYDPTALVGITIGLDPRVATSGGPGDYITDTDGRVRSPDGRRPVAKVVLSENRTDIGEPPTLLLNYESGDKFSANDFVRDRAALGKFNAVVNNTISSSGNEVGNSSYVGITSGVYFITTSTGGYFAHVPKQRIILEKYSDTPTYKIGLNINETIVSENEDETLYDNAQGTYSQYAPGAHRLKIALELSKAPGSDGNTINPASSQDFVELLRIENGQRAYGASSSTPPLPVPLVTNIIIEAAADQAFDETGNYIVSDFDCRVEDAPDDKIKVTVHPKSGRASARAYIQGHAFEQSGPWTQYIEKARKTGIIKNISTPLNNGALMLVSNLKALGSQLSVGDLPIWDLHTCGVNQVNTHVGATGTSEEILNKRELAYKSTRAGKFRVRDVQYVTANTYAIYVTDFRGSAALTGNFSGSPTRTDVETIGVGPSIVKIQTGNTSVYENAYIGSKFSITYSHYHPDFAGQTRTVIASSVDIHGTDTLTLDAPINQPTNNTAHFPGDQDIYALNADIRAAATGNGCIIASTINDSGVVIGLVTDNPDLPANKNGSAEIAKIGTIANTSIFGGGTFPSLIYKLPVGGSRVANSIETFASGGSNFEFPAQYSTTAAASGSPGVANFDPKEFRGASFAGTQVFFSTAVKESYTLINETTGSVIDPDEYVMVSSGTAPSITALAVAATGAAPDFSSDTMRLIGPVRVTDVTSKRKTLLRGINAQDNKDVPIATDRTNSGNSWITFAKPNTLSGGKDNLGLVDVLRIVDIYDTGDISRTANGAMLNNTQHRVTSNYTLDAGQSEALYDYASVVLKPGAKAPKGQLAVVVDRFIHDNSKDGGVFTVDSYNGQVSIENIPSFVSYKSGQRYNLGEYIDFRPSRAVEINSSLDANTSYYVPIVSQPTSSDHRVLAENLEVLHPSSQGSFKYDMQYFAPRFDKIILSVRQIRAGGANTGYMRIISGTDNQNPAIPPKVHPHDMAIFTLALPSYTRRASDINVMPEGNRRWTMKDIGKISRRLDRLEYYSSLNMIEQDVSNLKIFDASGQLERFKHGFIVDNFQTGTSLADVGHPITGPNFDFQASIGRGVLRPAYESENISLLWDPTTSTGVQETNGVLHLPYTTTSGDAFLQQIRATSDGGENINPFDVKTWQGTVSLVPSSDIWKSTVESHATSTQTSPSGYQDSLIAMAETLNDRMGSSMTVWGEWDTEWGGSVNGETETMIMDEAGEFAKVYQSVNWGKATAYAADGFGNPITSHAAFDLNLGTVSLPAEGNLSARMRAFDLPNTDWVSYRERKGEDEHRIEWMPNQTHVFADEVSTTVKTTTGTSIRTGIRNEYEVSKKTTEIGEFVVGSSSTPFMRPLDITFKVRGLKPDTLMFPHFDDVDIRNYTERANELTLSAGAVYSNPYADGEILSGPPGTGRAIISGFNPGSNTYYVTSANGAFASPDSVTGSISALSRAVEQYKNYSGSVQTSATASTLKLDASASDWWLPNTTTAPLAAEDLEKDLYGKTLYITEGRGYGQSRTITSFADTTDTVTLNTPWSITPNTQSRYSISDHRSSLSGDLYGVFHVPNYNWANRLLSARKEGTDSDNSAMLESFEPGESLADERTDDVTRFPTGNRSFSVRDSLSTATAESFGIGPFMASGLIETRQKRYQDSYGLTLTPRDVTDEENVSKTEDVITTRRVEVGTICWADPLAQSILVDPHRYPEGLFVDSVDLWFKVKPDTTGIDKEGIPVEVQLRPTIGGMPSGGEIMTSVIKYPSEVNVSSGEFGDLPDSVDETKYTNFKFERPVYLNGGTEYAIVLMCADTSYEVWTAKVGSDEVGTGGETGIPAVAIDSQPHLGSLFKSQNGSTWVPEVNQDLMFRIHKCVFDTSVVGSAIWKSANAMSQYVPSYTRSTNALIHTNWVGSSGAGEHALSTPTASPYAFKVWDKNFTYHRFRVDSTQLDYPSGFTGFSYAAASAGDMAVPDVASLSLTQGFTSINLHRDIIPETSLDIIKDSTGSFVLKGAITTQNEDISPMINLERMSLTMIKNLINHGELSANTWPVNYITTDDYSSGNVVGGGFYIENPGLNYLGWGPSSASITAADKIVITTEDGNIGSGATGYPIVNSVGSIVGVHLNNAGSAYLHAPTISFTDASDTPIDKGAVIKYVGEDSPQGPGNFLARYMTKRVVMSPGAEAKDIKIYLTASQVPGTIIWVYTKVRNKADIDTFAQKNWVLAVRMQPFGDEVSPTDDYYREIQFMGGGADDDFPLSYNANLDGASFGADSSPAGERFDTFNEFAIKIVMQSIDARIVPVIKDLRAIAVE